MQNKVELSMLPTSSLPKIDNQTASRMLLRIKNGETELKDEFIKGNLRLVLSVVQKFSGRRENMDDIFQIGCVGLIKAIDNFDMSFNVKFSTYAVPMDIFKGKGRTFVRLGLLNKSICKFRVRIPILRPEPMHLPAGS